MKLCVGQPHEILAVVKAILKTGIKPDYIVVDGAEGGTGAAPLELTNSVGMPLREGLIWVRNALDKKYATFYFESMGNGFMQKGRPVHFGVDIRCRF